MSQTSRDPFPGEDPAGAEMPLLEHLTELRSRLLRSALAVLVIFVPLFYFANDLYEFVSRPLRAALPEGSSMIATEVASPFLTPFKLAFVLAFFLAVPYILHQIWSFVAPGLYKHEKRLAVPLLASSIVLFYTGMAFAYFAVFPVVFAFLIGVAPGDVAIMTDINAYLTFVLKMFFAFGFAFEIPVATLLLVWSGATNVATLRQKRAYVLVGCFIFAMLLTPPDVISQVLLAIPMWALYEVGILFAHWVEPRGTETDQDT